MVPLIPSFSATDTSATGNLVNAAAKVLSITQTEASMKVTGAKTTSTVQVSSPLRTVPRMPVLSKTIAWSTELFQRKRLPKLQLNSKQRLRSVRETERPTEERKEARKAIPALAASLARALQLEPVHR